MTERETGVPASWNGRRTFATTRWSVVMDARLGGSESRTALEELCRIYWPPVYCWIRRKGHDPEKALDRTQSFFVRLLGSGLANVDPELGRFRSWLIRAVENSLANDHREETAGKRDYRKLDWLDADEAEARFERLLADPCDAETAFLRSYTLTLLNQALERLEREYTASGKAHEFEVLKGFVLGNPSQREPRSGAELAAELGVSEGTFRQRAHRFRQRWIGSFRDQVHDAVGAAEEVEPELRFLLSVMKDAPSTHV